MTTPEKDAFKKLTLKRETVRVIVRTGIRTGPISVPMQHGDELYSVRQGTLSGTGQGADHDTGK